MRDLRRCDTGWSLMSMNSNCGSVVEFEKVEFELNDDDDEIAYFSVR